MTQACAHIFKLQICLRL